MAALSLATHLLQVKVTQGGDSAAPPPSGCGGRGTLVCTAIILQGAWRRTSDSIEGLGRPIVALGTRNRHFTTPLATPPAVLVFISYLVSAFGPWVSDGNTITAGGISISTNFTDFFSLLGYTKCGPSGCVVVAYAPNDVPVVTFALACFIIGAILSATTFFRASRVV